MAAQECVAELVGFFDGGFKNRERLVFDTEAAQSRPGLTFQGVEAPVRRLVVVHDRKRIHTVDAHYDIEQSLPRRATQDRSVRQVAFTLAEDERLEELRLFFSFSADSEAASVAPTSQPTQPQPTTVAVSTHSADLKKELLEAPVVPTTETTDPASTSQKEPSQVPQEGAAAGGSRTDIANAVAADGNQLLDVPDSAAVVPRVVQSLLQEVPTRPKQSEWGMRHSQLCGIELKTNNGRKFKVMATDLSVFKTKYTVDVRSGNLVGILQEKSTTSKPSTEIPSMKKSSMPVGQLAVTGIGFLFTEEHNQPAPGERARSCGLKRLKRRILQAFPILLLTLFTILRILLLQVVLPLYDIVSDFVAAYYYYDEDFAYISAIILILILLPHAVQSIAVIWEMILDIGEFDEYPSFVVKFYKAKFTPWFVLDTIIKLLTLPFFTLYMFVCFFINLVGFAMRAVSKVRSVLVAGMEGEVGQRHSEQIRDDNIKDDSWAKSVLLELFFETIPQLLTQVSALAALYESNDVARSFPILSSIAVSLINFLHNCWIVRGFMKVTYLTFFNTMRIVLSSALDFFPIFTLYRNTAEFILVRFYDNPILLELWGPLKNIMMRNSALKSVVLYIEDAKDWLEMSLDLLDSVKENGEMALEMLDVCVEAANTEEAEQVNKRMEEFKARFYELLDKERVKKVFLLIDSEVDIGIGQGPISEATTDSATVDGYKWSWKWPPGKTAKIEYLIERLS